MIKKLEEKEAVIKLRKQGFTYSEILKKIPVAKSSISLWLHSVGMAEYQNQRITKKRINAIKKGWEACRRKRIEKEKNIEKSAYQDLRKIEINRDNYG